MDTEYRGLSIRALLLEVRQTPLSVLFCRAAWQVASNVGWHRLSGPPGRTEPRALCGRLPLRSPTPAALLEYFRTRTATRFLFGRDDLGKIRRAWEARLPQARAPLVAAAERVCNHEFEILGVQKVFSGGTVDWHDAFDGSGRWPLRHWSRLDLRSGPPGPDVRRTWELNRTQFFVTLARAYVLTGESRYAEKFCALLRSWLDQNPPGRGVNWSSGLECALRSVSWMFALEMTKDWEGWDSELFAEAVASLVDHRNHLVRNMFFARRVLGNNHLIGEAMGLALLALYLPELSHADRDRRRALDILVSESRRQILDGSVGFEMSSAYHRFVLSMYLMTGFALERTGEAWPDGLGRRLEGMCEFLLRLGTPAGRLPSVGDSDGGRLVVLDESAADDAGPLFCTAALRFRRGDFKAAAGGFREETLWLLGPDAPRLFDSLDATVPAVSDCPYPDAGFFLWRTGWSKRAEHLVFRCGPLAPHGHADNLSLLFASGGTEWLVDRGTFEYNLRGGYWPWRAYFRGSAAHNTVVVDGMGQALAHRSFGWLRIPEQRALAFHADSDGGYAAGATTGYLRLRSPVLHARSFLLRRGRYLLVLDALESTGTHRYDLLWHFDPIIEVRLEAGGIALAMSSAPPALRVCTVGTAPIAARVARGETDPIQGWHSPSYGVRQPAPTLVYEAQAAGPVLLASVLAAAESPDDWPERCVEIESGSAPWGDDVALCVTGPGWKERVVLPNPCRLSSGHVRRLPHRFRVDGRETLVPPLVGAHHRR